MSGLRLAIDIDETLAQTNLTWARHHIQTYGNPEALMAEEIIKKYRFVKDVPYWQIDEAKRWVEAEINSIEAQLKIPVIEESVAIMKRIPVVCYLTNRPAQTTKGTQEWLRMHGFPDKKVISSIKGLEWKAQTLKEMFPEVTGIIDDNIGLLEQIKSNYKGMIFLYSHASTFNSDLNVIPCPTWGDIGREVQRFM